MKFSRSWFPAALLTIFSGVVRGGGSQVVLTGGAGELRRCGWIGFAMAVRGWCDDQGTYGRLEN